MKKQPKKPRLPQKAKIFCIYKVVLIIESFLIIILAIANIMVGCSTSKNSTSNELAESLESSTLNDSVGNFENSTPNESAKKPENSTLSESTEDSNSNGCRHRTKEEIYNFIDDITKDDAISVVKNFHSEDRCIPQGFIPEKYKLKSNELAYTILYSYDDASEVTDIAYDSVMKLDIKSADDFQIDETTDYYTIISVDDSKVACGDRNENPLAVSCNRGISFNKKYLNRYEKVEGFSHDDETIFNDLSAEFVELALKIFMASAWDGNSFYDYYFEENSDNFVLTGIYFGVGVDLTDPASISVSNIPYAINIYEKKIILDKNTKKVYWEKHESQFGGEATTTIIKSFSLSDDELAELYAS